MNEPKLISPMLDDFAIGNHISDHHGVRCYPAMRNDSDQRYIVKVISVPASQVRLEALLLTGAYKSQEDALNYFESLANEVVAEVQVLKKLSELDGFLAYEDCQVVPMEGSVGYEVYLLSPYKRSLSRVFRKQPMTHLAAVNLGLDICAALQVCRQAGYLYVDLKPENIYIGEKQEYRIGDLGFIRLDSLKYSALPEKYRSSYTAPESADTFCTVSKSLDIFALGLILYQAYNGGVLPYEGRVPKEPLIPPMYADYEMAEIILKACNPDPAQRWESPVEMGQALVSYMQRNGANDTPIIPPSAEDVVAPHTDAINSAAADKPMEDDTAPDEDTAAGVAYQELTGEANIILEQADDLIAHPAPDGVVQPVPAPLNFVEADDSEEPVFAAPVQTVIVDNPQDQEYPFEEEYPPEKTNTGKKVLIFVLILALLSGLVFSGYIFYKEYYLQPIRDLRLEGNEDELRVYLTTDSDPDRLIVICTDIYGTARQSSVTNGMAVFTGLNPNTLYKVDVQINGIGKLTGDISESYTTPAQYTISNFTAVTGPEAGSVILSFHVDGGKADNWTITVTAEGEDTVTEQFTGHMVTVYGLTQGKTYTFRLASNSDIYLTGEDTLEYTAADPIYAQNLTVLSCDDGQISVSWEPPVDINVTKWFVHCYSPNGYDETITVEDTTATFTGVTCSDAHTIVVTADSMSSGAMCYISANSVTVKDLSIQQSGTNTLKLSWNTGDTKPAGKWLITYSIDGMEDLQQIAYTGTNSLEITPIVPNAEYHFTFQLEGGATVMYGEGSFRTNPADEFSGYLVKTKNISSRMCKVPNKTDWTHNDIKKADYTDTFKLGTKAGFVLQMNHIYDTSNDMITTMYVIRDADGNPISWDSTAQTWTSMWYKNFCELTIPQMPILPGSYTIEIYFNGCRIHNQAFTVTE